MKKMLVLLMVLALSFAIIGCKKDEDTVDDVANVELVSTESFEVDVIGSYEYTYGERVYIYKHIVGYTDEKNPQPIYALVVSKDVYDVGDTFEVATIRYANGNNEFDYRTIQFESGEFDTSWHKYAERL